MSKLKRNRKGKGKGPSGSSNRAGNGGIRTKEQHPLDYALLAKLSFEVGLEQIRSGDSEGAIFHFDNAIDCSPNFVDAHIVRGSAKASLWKHSDAIADCDIAIELDPECGNAYYVRASSKAELGDDRGAIDDFDRAIYLGVSPSLEALAYFERGNRKANRDDHSGAIVDYGDAIAINHPDTVFLAYYNRGYSHTSLGNHEKAIADFSRVIEQDPYHDADAYCSRANSRLQLGDFGGAIEDYDGAIAADPTRGDAINNLVIHLNRGIVRAGMGDTGGAISDYDLADNGETVELTNQALVERDQAITEANQALVERDQAITERNQARLQVEQHRAELQQIVSRYVPSTNGRRQQKPAKSIVAEDHFAQRVEFYADIRGHFPFIDWLGELDRNRARTVRDALSQITKGNFSNSKSLRADGVFERRLMKQGLRLYYAKTPDKKVLVLGGSGKPDQSDEIRRAAEHFADWKQRYQPTTQR